MVKKQAPRNTAKYIGRKGRKSVKAGVTDRPLEERQAEVQSERGNGNVKLTKVGRRTTLEAALEWERQQRDKLTHRKKK